MSVVWEFGLIRHNPISRGDYVVNRHRSQVRVARLEARGPLLRLWLRYVTEIEKMAAVVSGPLLT
jgi:hypothetical protein